MSDEPKSNLNWKKIILIGAPIALAGAAGYFIYQHIHNKKVKTVDVPDTPQEVTDPLIKANSLKELGNKNFRVGRFDRAVDFYSQAINLCPTDANEELAIFYQNRAAAYQSNGQEDESLEDCNQALKFKKRYVKALSRRGRIYENKSMYREALEDATAVCLFECFNNEENVLRAERVMKQLGEDLLNLRQSKRSKDDFVLPSSNFISAFLKTYECDPLQLFKEEEEEEDNDKSELETQNGHIKNSSYSKISFESLKEALKLLRNGNYDECYKKSLEVIQEIQRDPSAVNERDQLLAYLLRGTMYHLAYRQTEALDDFRYVVKTGEKIESERNENFKPDVRDIIVNALIKMGVSLQEDQLQSTGCYEKAIAILPKCPDIYSHRAQQRLSSDDTDPMQVIADFEKAVKLSPSNPIHKGHLHYVNVMTHFRQMNMASIESEISKWNELIDKYPDCHEIHSLQGQFLVDVGRQEEAVKRFKRALELQPNSATAHVHLAMAQMRQDAAKTVDSGLSFETNISMYSRVSNDVKNLLRKAIEVEPNSSTAHETWAMVLTQTAELQLAVHHYDKASELTQNPKETANLLALRESVQAQLNIMERYSIDFTEMQELRNNAMVNMLRKNQAAMARSAGDY